MKSDPASFPRLHLLQQQQQNHFDEISPISASWKRQIAEYHDLVTISTHSLSLSLLQSAIHDVDPSAVDIVKIVKSLQQGHPRSEVTAHIAG